MNFYVRTNFGSNVGLGHISRISRLLDRLRKKHSCSIFVDKFDYENLDLSNRFYIQSLYSSKNKYKNQLEDSKIFLSQIKKLPKGIVIVDDYRLGSYWEKLISNHCSKVISIDDFLYKSHYSDILINSKPNFFEFNFDRIKKINKKNCKFLLGPKFTILDSIKNGKVKKNSFKIIFYTGGSGDLNIFKGVIKNILKRQNTLKKKIIIQVIIGPYSKNVNGIVELSKIYKNIKIILKPKNLNNILKNSNLLISTSGLISFEAAHCKIPSLLFQINKNQETDILSMQLLGHYLLLKKYDLEKKEKVSNLILLLIKNYKRVKLLSQNPKFKIDGRGAERILDVIFNKKNHSNNFKKLFLKNEIKQKKINVSKVNDKEINLYLKSRNLSINVQNSANKKKIDNLDHYIWWFGNKKRNSYLVTKNNQRLLYIYETLFTYKKKNYVYPGYIVCKKNLSILEILWALRWQNKNIDYKYKKYTCIISARKKINFPMNTLNISVTNL